MFLTLRRSSRGPVSLYAAGRRSCQTPAGSMTWSSTDTIFGLSGMFARLQPALFERAGRPRDCHALTPPRVYALAMPLRIHPVSRERWARLAATRFDDTNDGRVIDLVALEAETHPGRRIRSEHALIQAQVDALAPQGVR